MLDDQKIKDVTDTVVKTCDPIKVILISHKISITKELTGFKLCIIVEDNVPSISELECSLYMNIDSEIPFDLVIYKKSEWDNLKEEIGTFAWKINDMGTVLYG